MNNLTLIFTKEQITILNAALIELPFKIAAPLVYEINAQIKKQTEQKFDEELTTP